MRDLSPNFSSYLKGKYNRPETINKITQVNRDMILKVNQLVYDYSVLYIIGKSVANLLAKTHKDSTAVKSYTNLLDVQLKVINLLKRFKLALKKYALTDKSLTDTLNKDLNAFNIKFKRDKIALDNMIAEFNIDKVFDVLERAHNTSVLEDVEKIISDYDINLHSSDLDSKEIKQIINGLTNMFNGVIVANRIKLSSKKEASDKENKAIVNEDKRKDRNSALSARMREIVDGLYRLSDGDIDDKYVAATSDGYNIIFMTTGARGSKDVLKAKLFDTVEEAEKKLNAYTVKLTNNRYRYNEIIKVRRTDK